jgi:glycosyltransferase involved in cell wall biosynthesis
MVVSLLQFGNDFHRSSPKPPFHLISQSSCGKDVIVTRSLSLVLPVANVEKTLTENVQNLFELLNDLTDKFEIILVDQGSIDHTIDVARELAIQYPQVRIAHRCEVDQQADLIHKTLPETTGDLVFLQTGHTGVRPSALRQLWCLDERHTSPSGQQTRVGRLPEPPASLSPQIEESEVDGLRVVRRSKAATHWD